MTYNKQWLSFEQPIADIYNKIEELDAFASAEGGGQSDDIERLSKKAEKATRDIYSKLTPWQITQVARHPARPYALDYIETVFDDFVELHGDRAFKDDAAIVGGLARLDGRGVVVIGQQKGRNTKEKIHRNFGMPHPEGYRKALRLMELAERFKRPIITLIDTPGAYPGVEAEERGQSEAIARNLIEMSVLKVPIVSIVIGEGGSGGALALGVADKVLMLEYTTYSVISPEGCAAILWKDGTKADLAAKALKIRPEDHVKLGVVDRMIPEPLGGAHRDYSLTGENVKKALIEELTTLIGMDVDLLVSARYDKFRAIGAFKEPESK